LNFSLLFSFFFPSAHQTIIHAQEVLHELGDNVVTFVPDRPFDAELIETGLRKFKVRYFGFNKKKIFFLNKNEYHLRREGLSLSGISFPS